MNRFFKRLPLLSKLLVIAIVPLLFIFFLTFQVFQAKSRNETLIRAYLDRINQSLDLTRLIDQLQKERRYSFDYLLSGAEKDKMVACRPVTDSLLSELILHHDRSLAGFNDYSFLEPLDSTRASIDRHQLTPDLVIHFYSAAIFRLSTLNEFPTLAGAFLQGIYGDISSQKILSEMITYLGIIDANVYNILYTRLYIPGTLLGTLGTYEVYKSYEKQLEAMAYPETLAKYHQARSRSGSDSVDSYLHRLFTTFSLDSIYTAKQWTTRANTSLNAMRGLQLSLLYHAQDGINAYYHQVRGQKTEAVVLMAVCTGLVIFLVFYILTLIHTSLNELSVAAIQISEGGTDLRLEAVSRDAIGSLTQSILQIDKQNKELAEAARIIGQGNFNYPLSPRSGRDLLSNAILQMQASLRNFTSDLNQSREAFRQLADFMPQIVWTASPEGFVDYYNRKWYETTGAGPELGDKSLIPLLHPEDLGKFLTVWYRSIETGLPFELQYRLKVKDAGQYRWFLGRALPIRDNEEKILKWFGTATDIHDQKMQHSKLEELIARRTMELQRSNEDLQQFAHVASHDLKEPLRKIRTFCGRLIDDFREFLPEKGRTYLDKIQLSSERMTALIDSVLSYSVLNASQQAFETVDLNLVLEGIREDLELLIIQKNAGIQCDRLPPITAEPTLIHQLFYNLLVNALKFSREGSVAEIRITSGSLGIDRPPALAGIPPNGHYLEIVIRDNGIGFNPDFSARMFDIFTRLNPRDKYEGVGLGLALCKKIVQRYSGAIYAEGREGEGAAFHIILPESQPLA